MTGRCMCGDLNCPSCGPAQGHNPEMEALFDAVYEKFTWLTVGEELNDCLAKVPGEWPLDFDAEMGRVIDFVFEEGRKAGVEDAHATDADTAIFDDFLRGQHGEIFGIAGELERLAAIVRAEVEKLLGDEDPEVIRETREKIARFAREGLGPIVLTLKLTDYDGTEVARASHQLEPERLKARCWDCPRSENGLLKYGCFNCDKPIEERSPVHPTERDLNEGSNPIQSDPNRSGEIQIGPMRHAGCGGKIIEDYVNCFDYEGEKVPPLWCQECGKHIIGDPEIVLPGEERNTDLDCLDDDVEPNKETLKCDGACPLLVICSQCGKTMCGHPRGEAHTLGQCGEGRVGLICTVAVKQLIGRGERPIVDVLADRGWHLTDCKWGELEEPSENFTAEKLDIDWEEGRFTIERDGEFDSSEPEPEG